MTTTLQASLVYKPPPSLSPFNFSTSYRHRPSVYRCYSSFNFCLVSKLNSFYLDSTSLCSCFCRYGRLFVVNCTLNPDALNLTSPDNDKLRSDPEKQSFTNESISGANNSSGGNSGSELVTVPEPVGGDSGDGVSKIDEMKRKLPIVAFLIGFFATARKGFEKFLSSEWFSWWPFWRQEKRLERLILEADANPKDAAAQGALLAKLNKHRLG